MRVENASESAEARPHDWIVRGYVAGDEHAIVELFQRAFRKSMSVETWRWKLKGLPSPVENVFLALHDARLICHYSGIPVRFRLLDAEPTVMVGADAMSDGEHRRRGLLTAVSRASHSAWRHAGVPFVLGLPNEQWGSRVAALGWQSLFALRWWGRPLRPEALLARRLGVPWLADAQPIGRAWNRCLEVTAPRTDSRVTCRHVERAGSELDALWSRVGSLFSVVRDSRFLNWRYCDAPGYGYRLIVAERDGATVGYAAYRARHTPERVIGYIADVFVPQPVGAARSESGTNGPREVRRALLRSVLCALQEAGADMALTLSIAGMPLEADLRRFGFFLRPGAFGVQLNPLVSELPLDALRDPRRWHIAGGDFDVV